MHKYEATDSVGAFALVPKLRYNLHMRKMRGAYRPRAIDRAVFAILAVLHTASALYLVGPWYLTDWDEEGKAPLTQVFHNETAVTVYGGFLLLNGLALIYATAGRSAHRYYTTITSSALLTGFLLRLYALIGVIAALESWRPPSYLSQLATVALCGAYWVWIKVHARPIQ